METASQSNDQCLPEDLVYQILTKLDHTNLRSASLVCKLFCSVSNPLVHKLTLNYSYLTDEDFQRLFKRFPCVNKIDINFHGQLDDALLAISNSSLNLEKLKLPLPFYAHMNLRYPQPQTIGKMSTSRVIKCVKSLYICNFQDPVSANQIISFLNLFPSLTELNFGNIAFRSINDTVIEEVTSKLPNLQKINLGYNKFLTDKTLDILSLNCPKLETVNFICDSFSPEALYKFFCRKPQLISSLDLPYYHAYYVPKIVECIHSLQNRNHLSLQFVSVDDRVLKAVAESRPPLKSLVIANPKSQNYTMVGLSQLLSALPKLERVDLHLPDAANYNHTHDAEMSLAVKRLPNLKHITLWSPHGVYQASVFSLVQNCPLLETIVLMRDSWYKGFEMGVQDILNPTTKNYSIQSIHIIPEESGEWLLSKIEPYCPNLRK